jgi:hypothetical protein
MFDRRIQTGISVLKVPDHEGNQCVGVVLSQNALFETAEGDPRAGVALNRQEALLVIQKIATVLLEMETVP